MSRRTPNPAAERAAQNAQAIKSLLKLDGNKMCADCKRNKHPRWASWNLGVFICIRCSGIHRGMGTHISRVKSVDLDAWTDEQLQSILKWGNARANKYWEAKLASGHLPSESKIENFIRTKYESKRWVMEGPIPDPSTLSADGEDDLPLSVIKEKQNIDRLNSQRVSPSPSLIRKTEQPDIFGNDISTYSRENYTTSITSKMSPKANPATPKVSKPADSLLGLDFFGTGSTPPSRPSSAVPIPGGQSRPDLKQSILSLYATAPRPQQQQTLNSPQGTFGSVQSPIQKSSTSSVSDAFSSLSFSNQKSPIAQSQLGSSAFSELGNVTSHKGSFSGASSHVNGGNFFENKSIHKSSQQSAQIPHVRSNSSVFGAFDSASGPLSAVTTNNNSGLGDIFDFSKLNNQVSVPSSTVVSPESHQTSVFNLTPLPLPKKIEPLPLNSSSNTGTISNDTWGSNEVWANSGKSSPNNQPALAQGSFQDSGWGVSSGASAINSSKALQQDGNITGISGASTYPIVSADEEFGGWGSAAAPTQTTSSVPNKSAAGFAGNDDLFSNVWG